MSSLPQRNSTTNDQHRGSENIWGNVTPASDAGSNTSLPLGEISDFSSQIVQAVNAPDSLSLRRPSQADNSLTNRIALSREGDQQKTPQAFAGTERVAQNNPVTLVEPYERISMPAENLIVDVLNPCSKDPTNAWFEELIWNPQEKRFKASSAVFSSKMRVIEGEHSVWSNYLAVKTAFAIFLDGVDKRPRLFVNTFCQHIGIKPGMGNPVYAGIIEPRQDEQGDLYYLINNDSGHYQPAATVDVMSILKDIVTSEGLSHLQLSTIEKDSAPENTRLTHITSIEDYAIAADALRRGGNKQQRLFDYLNQHNLWGSLKNQRSHLPWVQDLMKWEENQKVAPSVLEVVSKVPEGTAPADSSPVPSPGLWQRLKNWVSKASGYLKRQLFAGKI